MKSGKTYQDPAFISTDVDIERAIVFSGGDRNGFLFKDKVLSGKDIKNLSIFKDKESEYLMKSESKYKIIKIKKIGNKTHIEREEIL